jgi:hypothetical protein
MRKIIATATVSLDGVMQGPAPPKRTKMMGSTSADGSLHIDMLRAVAQS